jgi:hypothetical protein
MCNAFPQTVVLQISVGIRYLWEAVSFAAI